MANAFLFGTIEVSVITIASLLTCFDEGERGRMGLDFANVELTFSTMKLAVAKVMHLTFAEVREYLVERPARIAQSSPVVIVAVMASDIDHAVD